MLRLLLLLLLYRSHCRSRSRSGSGSRFCRDIVVTEAVSSGVARQWRTEDGDAVAVVVLVVVLLVVVVLVHAVAPITHGRLLDGARTRLHRR